MVVRVILATGKPELDAYLSERAAGIEVVDTVHYREALGDVARRWQPEGAVVSSLLEGRLPIADAVFPLRVRDVRVVMLWDRRPQKVSDPELGEITELLAMGVTDFLFSPVRAQEVVERLKQPWTFGQAVRDLLRGVRPPSRKLALLLGRLAEQGEEPGAPPGGRHGGRRDVSEGDDRPARPGRAGMGLPDHAPAAASREEGEAPVVLGRTSRPSVGFWSPVGAGASTLALAAAYLLGRDRGEVSLLDLGEPPALGALLCLPAEDFAGRVLAARPGERPSVPRVGPLWVLPGTPGRVPEGGDLGRLLSPAALPGDLVVVDLPRSGPVLEAVLPAVWAVVVVGDPDWRHVAALRDALSYARSRGVRAVPVLNRYAPPAGPVRVDPVEVFGEEPVAVVPALPAEVYGAVVAGDPVSRTCGEFAAALAPLLRVLAGLGEAARSASRPAT